MNIEQKELAEALGQIQSIVPTKPITEALNGVLWLEDKLVANNLEVAMEIKLSQTTETMVIIPQTAIKMIYSLPNEMVKLEEKDGKLHIATSKTKTSYSTFDPSAFPLPNPEDTQTNTTVNAKQFQEALQSVAFAVSINENRPPQTGVFLEGGEGELEVVACDGYRAAWAKLEAEVDFKATIPMVAVQKLMKLKFEKDEELKIGIGDNYAEFRTEKLCIYSRLISGEFLDYKKAFELDGNLFYAMKTKLAECIDRAIIYSGGEKKSLIVLEIEGEAITASLQTRAGEYTEEIPLENNWKSLLKIGFNGTYLHECLKAHKGEVLVVKASTGAQGAVFSSGNLSVLLLPVRLRD